jgi:hypothetical protein
MKSIWKIHPPLDYRCWASRMDAGIATDQLAVVHRKPVWITGVRHKVHRSSTCQSASYLTEQGRYSL